MGANQDGAFGSSVSAPSGYHPNTNSGSKLGFVSDRGKGWGVGTDDGDFFTPGDPYEGWSLQVGDSGTPHWNSVDSGQNVAGTWSDASSTSTDNTATWTAASATAGVAVKQVVSVPSGAQYLTFDVTLKNTSSAPLTDVYYARAVDPDNCKMRTTPVCDTNGDGVADGIGTYRTWNQVRQQETAGDSMSRVSADQTDGSYMDLRTSAAGAIAATATPSGHFCEEPALQASTSPHRPSPTPTAASAPCRPPRATAPSSTTSSTSL